MAKKKILVAEMKDGNGVKVITALTDDVYLSDVLGQVRNDLAGGCRSVSVKFYQRTQAWLDKQPEYEG